MENTHAIGEKYMEKTGLFGMLATWLLNLFAASLQQFLYIFNYAFFLQEIETLQRFSLWLAILVSIFTLMWYIGNMLIKRKEWLKAIKELLKKKGV